LLASKVTRNDTPEIAAVSRVDREKFLPRDLELENGWVETGAARPGNVVLGPGGAAVGLIREVPRWVDTPVLGRDNKVVVAAVELEESSGGPARTVAAGDGQCVASTEVHLLVLGANE